MRVRIIDKAAEPGTTSRALAVQARTLELYRPARHRGRVVARGVRRSPPSTCGCGASARRASPIVDIGRGLSPFPYPLIFPQDEHERLLIEHLEALGVAVERQTELVGFEQHADGV